MNTINYNNCQCLSGGRPRRFKRAPVIKNSMAVTSCARGSVFHSGETVFVIRVWGNCIYLLKLDDNGTPIFDTVYLDHKRYYKFI